MHVDGVPDYDFDAVVGGCSEELLLILEHCMLCIYPYKQTMKAINFIILIRICDIQILVNNQT